MEKTGVSCEFWSASHGARMVVRKDSGGIVIDKARSERRHEKNVVAAKCNILQCIH